MEWKKGYLEIFWVSIILFQLFELLDTKSQQKQKQKQNSA